MACIISKLPARLPKVIRRFVAKMVFGIQAERQCCPRRRLSFWGISLVSHRDKPLNNAMLAKAVEACVNRGGRFLVYGHYDYGTGGGGLTEFKAQNGFQKIPVPRYYVPLTLRGRLGLVLSLHKGIKGMVPKKFLRGLVALRKGWYLRKNLGVASPPEKSRDGLEQPDL